MSIFEKLCNKPNHTIKEETTMTTNIQKALSLINTFATGDTETAKGLLAEGYIQHNLAYGTGRDAFIGSVACLASAPVKTTVRNIRAFEDGDKVFLQTVYNFAGAGEQVAFDIFRFDTGGQDRRALGQSGRSGSRQPLRPHPNRRRHGHDRPEQDRGQPGAGQEFPLRCDAGQQRRQDARLLRWGRLYPA